MSENWITNCQCTNASYSEIQFPVEESELFRVLFFFLLIYTKKTKRNVQSHRKSVERTLCSHSVNKRNTIKGHWNPLPEKDTTFRKYHTKTFSRQSETINAAIVQNVKIHINEEQKEKLKLSVQCVNKVFV